MAKTKISEFSTTAGNNTDINSINIAEGCAPSGINDAIRELMRQLKEFQTGGAGDSVNSGGDFSVATNKFTVAAASGNTAVAGTLAVTGVATLTAQPILSSLTASKAVFTDASKGLVSNDVTGTGNVVMSNSPTLVTPALGTPSSGVVTNLTGTASININGTVGATTPSTGAFTTLSSTGNTTLGDASGDTITVNGTTTFVNANPTLSAGTANGVLYLNASKVATSGTALTFDGTNLGLGVTPFANTIGKSIDLVNGGGWFSYNNISYLSANAYFNEQWLYKANGNATLYQSGSGQHSWLTAPSGTAGNAITFTQAMTLDASGNLGIGTSSPVSKLHIESSSAESFQIGYSSTKRSRMGTTSAGDLQIYAYETGVGYHDVRIGYDGTTAAGNVLVGGNLGLGVTPSAWNSGFKAMQIGAEAIMYSGTGGSSGFNAWGSNFYVDSAGDARYIRSSYANSYQQNRNLGVHAWYNAPSGTAGDVITFTPAMTLDASGNLLVGTTAAAYNTDERVSINGASTKNGIGISVSGSGAKGIGIYNGNSTGATNGTMLEFQNSGSGVVGSITSNGTTTAYNVTSDQRLKENIVDAPEFGSVIDSIKVRSYDWKTDGNHQRAGFVAQELVTVAPEAVHQPADPEEMMAVDYSKLVPMLVKEIQSLRKRLADAGIA